MKTVKLFDILITLSLIGWFVYNRYWDDLDTMITAYFTVGGWQVISMLLHAFMGWFNKPNSIRRIYHWISFIAVVTIPAGSYWVMGFLASPMAVFYSVLCIVEFFKIKNRPLSLLK